MLSHTVSHFIQTYVADYSLSMTFPLDYSALSIYSANYCDVAVGGVQTVNISFLPCNLPLTSLIKCI